MKSLFPEHMAISAKVMDFRLERQNVVSSNLANLNTPGYKARRLEFEKNLQAALDIDGTVAKTHEKHMPHPFDPEKTTASLSKEFAPRVVQGVDNVDLDTEMAIMSKNTLMYKALSTVIQNNFTGLKKVIQDGGR